MLWKIWKFWKNSKSKKLWKSIKNRTKHFRQKTSSDFFISYHLLSKLKKKRKKNSFWFSCTYTLYDDSLLATKSFSSPSLIIPTRYHRHSSMPKKPAQSQSTWRQSHQSLASSALYQIRQPTKTRIPWSRIWTPWCIYMSIDRTAVSTRGLQTFGPMPFSSISWPIQTPMTLPYTRHVTMTSPHPCPSHSTKVTLRIRH